MTEPSTERVHGTAISIHGRAVLILGLSGSGKSDLALRLIDRGALLVSDDQVLLTRSGNRLIADAPPAIAGMIEVRGLGLLERHHRGGVPLALVVQLGECVDRLPEDGVRQIAGVPIPGVTIVPFELTAAIKVELALARHGLPE